MNNYPNPANYPSPGFDQPILSPDVDPDAGDLVSASFNADWIPALEGAMSTLTQPAAWVGTDDEKKLAMARAITLRAILAGAEVGTVPAPYWDTPEDADDEAPKDDQVWYGRMEGTTFVEDVGIWVITGFIAYSGQIGAAIAFKTFAPKFALAWKTGGIVGAIRVFIDGVDSGLLDTHSDTEGVLEQDFVGDPDLDEHDILQIVESLP